MTAPGGQLGGVDAATQTRAAPPKLPPSVPARSAANQGQSAPDAKVTEVGTTAPSPESGLTVASPMPPSRPTPGPASARWSVPNVQPVTERLTERPATARTARRGRLRTHAHFSNSLVFMVLSLLALRLS